MCSCLPPHSASLLLWLQQWGRPLLQPGGRRGPGGPQVGAQLVRAPQMPLVEACGVPRGV